MAGRVGPCQEKCLGELATAVAAEQCIVSRVCTGDGCRSASGYPVEPAGLGWSAQCIVVDPRAELHIVAAAWAVDNECTADQ